MTHQPSIWDLKKGDKFKVSEGYLCEVLAPTEDGKGVRVRYLDGDLKGQEDFVFAEEILFKSPSK
jgi:hypothetical protein